MITERFTVSIIPFLAAMWARCKRRAAAAVLLSCALGVFAPAQAAIQKESFTFTKVDLELLEKSNQLDRYFEEKGRVFADAETTDYVTGVGQTLAPEPPENVTWRFRVLRDPLPNAFALPNGSIYIQTGLLALLENEAQLASVLAHEVTHVLNRHSYLAYRSYRKKMVAIHIIQAAGNWAGVAGPVAGLVADIVASVMPVILVASIHGYSRDLEREADTHGARSLVEAGYQGEEMVHTFRLLQKSHEVELTKIYYTDHPKLEERIGYVGELVNMNPPKVEQPITGVERYFQATEKVVRHNVGLDILAGRMRTARAVAQRLVTVNPGASENFYCLGESFRALGPRTPEPSPEERSSKGIKQMRKMMNKMTLQEYETALMAKPEGKMVWQANQKQSEEAYRQALELDPDNAKAHRGLGMLYERTSQSLLAIKEFRTYLELIPEAPDRLQITRRIEVLEKGIIPESPAHPPQ